MQVFKRMGGWIEDRTGLAKAILPIIRHPVPKTDWKTGWWYVFGSAILVAFIVLVVTGIALATSYVSATSDAYNSLKFITDEAPFGRMLRGIHNWAASAMVLLVGLHAIQVYLWGAYKYPREMNWVTGVILLALTLGMAFTGQLLRWDQTAAWSVFVGASMAANTPFVGTGLAKFILGGETLGGATLSRFFAFHVFFIPALLFTLIGAHLFLVVRNGISEPPKRGEVVDPKTYRQKYEELLEKHGEPFWPYAAWRDVVFGVGVVIGIVLMALFVGPPELGKPPDPSLLDAYPRPDWYFLWIFSVLALIPAKAESVAIILGPLLIGVVLLFLPFFANKGERSPLRRPWSVAVVLIIIVMVSTLWIAGEQAPWSPNFAIKELPQEVVGATSGPVYEGSQLFFAKGCQYCHMVGGYGGLRGPNLTNVGGRLTYDQLVIRILNGGNNMPAYGQDLQPGELEKLVAFLQSRRTGDSPAPPTPPGQPLNR